MWFLYILYSEKIDKYYIGITGDIEKRIEFHNRMGKGWTAKGRPWKIKFTKEFQNRKDAQFWERKIKKLKRRDIIETIISGNFIFESTQSTEGL